MRLRARLFAFFSSITIVLLAGCSSTPGNFPFTVGNLAPSEVTAGSDAFQLLVSGTNFHTDSRILFGDLALTPTQTTSTLLQVTVPASAVTNAATVKVAVTGSQTSSPLLFTIKNPVPAIVSTSQPEVLLNSTSVSLEISGSNFVSTSTVKLGERVLQPSSFTSTKLTVPVPDALLTRSQVLDLAVVNPGPGGGTSTPIRFTVLNPLPAITALSAEDALLNSTDLSLVISGTGFAPGMKVDLGPLVLDPAEISSTSATVTVPKDLFATAAVHNLTVVNEGPGGGISNAREFTVKNPAPRLSELSRDSTTAGSAPFELTLTGADFLPGCAVSMGGTPLSSSVVSDTQITLTIPAEQMAEGGEHPVLVSNPGPGGGPSNALLFTINNPAPTLSALTPTTAIRLSNNTTLTLAGSGFVRQSTVMLGTSRLVPSAFTPTEITLTVPAGALAQAGRLGVAVMNPGPGGGTSSPLQISVANPRPSLSGASPSSVSASRSGAYVVLHGSGFNVDTVVQMTSSALGTVDLPAQSIEEDAIALAIPADYLSTPGTLVFLTENPELGGGTSEPLEVVVHERAATQFETVVNNQTPIPGVSGIVFNSYNQPSVSNYGTVIFKGQSRGNSGPTVGVYLRDMSCAHGRSCGSDMSGAGVLKQLTAKGVAVPDPNNTLYNGSLAGFNEFPSFPRIDMDTEEVAFRGQSKPTWTFTTADGLESRMGSAGIFTTAANGQLKTGVGLLGTVPGFEYFIVPSAGGTRFDQFPGSPAIYHNYIAFKGNYTVGDTGKTGVYFRDVVADTSGQSAVEHPVYKIADSDTRIPNQPPDGTVPFGSTAPPSAADGKVVFLGLDNEDAPTMGGIYLATLPATGVIPDPAGLPLTTLVTVGKTGTQVPGEAAGVTFSRLSEGLSFDGRYVGFWGAWGTETRTRHLACGVDGNTDMLASCNENYPNGFDAEIPVHQGIFVYDTLASDPQHALYAIVKTGTGEFSDFMYWVFSGRPPNVGTGGSGGSGEEGESGPGEDVIPEPPRWRWSAFAAVEGGPDAGHERDQFKIAFKAQAGTSDGIYLAQSSDLSRIQTVIDTATPGSDVDHDYAPANAVIATIGLERDGLRNDQIVVTASMLSPTTTDPTEGETEVESNAGIYITPVETLPPPQN